MTSNRVENLFNCPGKGPVNIPVLVSLGFLPPTLLKVLDKYCLVKVSLVSQFDLGLLICPANIIIVSHMHSLACKLNSLALIGRLHNIN